MSKIFAVYDLMQQTYSEPYTTLSIESMQQFFHVLVNTHSNMPQHLQPEDYVIYLLGDYDEFTGKIELLPEKEIIGTLASLKEPCEICKRNMEENTNG
jgi:hypothetical protein